MSVLLHNTYVFICTIIFCTMVQIGYFLKTRKRMSTKHLIWVYIFLLYLFLVYMRTGVGTIWYVVTDTTFIRSVDINLYPFFIPSEEFGINIYDILNVIMLMPLGFLIPLIWPSFRGLKKMAIIGFLFSLAIELSQLISFRITDINDLMMNTFGAVLGYCVFKILFHHLIEKREEKPVYMKNEAIIYLICSFMGMFLLYNPFFR